VRPELLAAGGVALPASLDDAAVSFLHRAFRHRVVRSTRAAAARKRRGEIFTARVALYVQPMLEPNPAPRMIWPELAMVLQRLLFGLATKDRYFHRPALERPRADTAFCAACSRLIEALLRGRMRHMWHRLTTAKR